MTPEQHARVWERAERLLKTTYLQVEGPNRQLHEAQSAIALMAVTALCESIAQAYREEAERNPE